ncbi:RhoGEF domain containing protein [Acanthamoeba castellanii str. Neff]|uniref:RhoGEF domain containing protein n=1 Tax=Acanthamoeba castellanii (strain ATCC 30010 / Neff) TaxID=1257118 RepID=L8HHL5_ACACF|nr:RhoGEF domain containing protein [Acanthamoeba castellanii str. Neff]ELR23936.1 RhoGEF domain containing protein [Acanthamoeba castellanii str. Neff]
MGGRGADGGPERPQGGKDGHFHELLRDGVLLCRLMLSLKMGSVPRYYEGKDLNQAYRRKENIGFFLAACEECGIPPTKRFALSDLDRHGNSARVMECIEAIAETADKEWNFYFKLKPKEEMYKRNITFDEGDRKRAEILLARFAYRNTTASTASKEKALAQDDAPASGVMANEKVVRGVVLLQALVRGGRARKAYIKRVRDVAYRENVAREILQTEKDYVNNLMLLMSVFINPIKESLTDNVWKPKNGSKLGEVTLKEVKSLYNDLQVIVNYNGKLLRDLTPRVEKWTPHQKLGDIFLQLGLFLKVYTQYVKDYDRARSELAHARKNSLEFGAYITDLEKSNGAKLENKDIFAYLIMPVQRIPRYQLLLRDLLKHTEKDHNDFESLQKAEESEHVHLVSTIQSRFSNRAENLVVPGRKFVRQGTLIVWSVKQKKRQPNQVFLFSDLLVVAKSTGSGLAALKRKKPMAAEKDLKFRASFQLKYLVPRSIPDDPKNKHSFGLDTEFGESLIRFFAESELEKTEWVNELTTIKKKMDGDRAAREDLINSLTRKKGGMQGRELKRAISTIELNQAANELLGSPQIAALRAAALRPRGQSLTNDVPKRAAVYVPAGQKSSPIGGPASAPNSPYTSSLSFPAVDNGGCQPRFRTTSCRTLPKMAERPEGLESSLKTTTVVPSSPRKKSKSKSKEALPAAANEEKDGAADNDDTSSAQ